MNSIRSKYKLYMLFGIILVSVLFIYVFLANFDFKFIQDSSLKILSVLGGEKGEGTTTPLLIQALDFMFN